MTVQLVCTANNVEAGTIVVTPVVNECPTWNTILADPSSLTTTPPGNTSLISASASAPGPDAAHVYVGGDDGDRHAQRSERSGDHEQHHHVHLPDDE